MKVNEGALIPESEQPLEMWITQQVCVRRGLGFHFWLYDKCFLLFYNSLVLGAFHVDLSPFLPMGKIFFWKDMTRFF